MNKKGGGDNVTTDNYLHSEYNKKIFGSVQCKNYFNSVLLLLFDSIYFIKLPMTSDSDLHLKSS